MERLDRSYASMDWLTEFPHTNIRNLPIIHSDHGPILLQTTQAPWSRRRPYQIENWSLQFNDVKTIIVEIWEIQFLGSTAYTITRWLDMLRTRLKMWCLDRKLS